MNRKQEIKEQIIADVLDQGATTHKSMWRILKELYETLTFRNLFWDKLPALAIAVTASFGFVTFYFMFGPEVSLMQRQFVFSPLVALAPMTFLLLMLFTELSERADGLFELLITLRYSSRQVAAFRILCFAGIGIIACILMSFLRNGELDSQVFVRALLLSLCALFLCALITVCLIGVWANKWVHLIVAAAWLTVTNLPVLLAGSRWEDFLEKLSVWIILPVTFVLLCLLLFQVKKILTADQRKVAYYALG